LEIQDEKIVRDRFVFLKGSSWQTAEKAKWAGVLHEECWAVPNENPWGIGSFR